MAKQIDHDQRRREIAGAVARVAGMEGPSAVSFRRVATEAGVSPALVQHYFGTKRNLVMWTLDDVSTGVAQRFMSRMAELPAGAGAIDRLRVIARSFLPMDEESRAALVFYHGVGAAALTDPVYRGEDIHHNATLLHGLYVDVIEQGQRSGEIHDRVDSAAMASLLAGTVTGLSMHALIDDEGIGRAVDAIEALCELMLAPR